MSAARLPSALTAAAMLRSVQAAGGHAAVLARGDPDSGALIVICTDRGALTSVRERVLAADGGYRWQTCGPRDSDALDEWITRRRRGDPDLWILELDIPDAERFAAGTSLTG